MCWCDSFAEGEGTLRVVLFHEGQTGCVFRELMLPALIQDSSQHLQEPVA